MKGSEIVASLNGIINTTCLKDLTPEDKATIRSLLRLINMCLCYQAFNSNAHHLSLTRYRLLVNDLKDLAVELTEVARDTEENISEVEAVLAQYYLKEILTS